jgi:uncharacterized membrane protein YgaE (UPF0421/DUF939 family)
MAARTALAMTATILAGRMLRIDEPVYAIIAVALVTDLTPRDTQRLGLGRIAGTIIGSVVGASLCMVLPSNPFTIGLGVLVAMFLVALTRIPAGARVAGLVCGVIILTHDVDPWAYALDRAIETTLGIVTAVLVSHMPKLLREEPKGSGEHGAP